MKTSHRRHLAPYKAPPRPHPHDRLFDAALKDVNMSPTSKTLFRQLHNSNLVAAMVAADFDDDDETDDMVVKRLQPLFDNAAM
jgi:hypothetical protein